MVDTTSPLQVINQKELELRHRVEEAHRQAEAQIQAAHKEAEQAVARADREGQAEAKALYQRGIEEAQQEAEAIVAAAHDKAVALRHQVTARLDEAAEQILGLVLPVNISLCEDAGLPSSDSILE